MIYLYMGWRPGRGQPSQHITSGWRESSAGRSTYLGISVYGEEARQKPAIPAHNLRMEGEFSR
jgi:hypothetical protein